MQAQSQAQVRPVQERIDGTKMFIERGQERVSETREACAKVQAKLAETEVQRRKEEGDLEDGERRLDALLQEADSTANFLPSGPPRTVPADFSDKLAQFRASVQDFQREMDGWRVQLQSDRANSENGNTCKGCRRPRSYGGGFRACAPLHALKFDLTSLGWGSHYGGCHRREFPLSR